MLLRKSAKTQYTSCGLVLKSTDTSPKNILEELGNCDILRNFQETPGTYPYRTPETGGWYGCFQKWWYPQIINFNRFSIIKPSILGYPYFWKHPYTLPKNFATKLPSIPSLPVPCSPWQSSTAISTTAPPGSDDLSSPKATLEPQLTTLFLVWKNLPNKAENPTKTKVTWVPGIYFMCVYVLCLHYKKPCQGKPWSVDFDLM